MICTNAPDFCSHQKRFVLFSFEAIYTFETTAVFYHFSKKKLVTKPMFGRHVQCATAFPLVHIQGSALLGGAVGSGYGRTGAGIRLLLSVFVER